MATIHIIRGAPGSGKSTLAKKICPNVVFEADQFFQTSVGYCFDASKLKAAHLWCLQEVTGFMSTNKFLECWQDCCVANTFTKRWEYQPYIEAAEKYGYSVQVIHCIGEWQNVHGVPPDTVQRMRDSFQPHCNSPR